ncbi:hypothetical protein EYF88_15750 [Paracoccus sediminis]|uniref:Uncharacterized protein n=1 Tax=Paracoccus sediminis TaxID=1214787 RepID=A0ABY1YF22_9RHOB|nr:hypothetical protein [Paracoccus sediminis]TBN46969.1 hypothetical protein EYF88_15750 [Paracoccus sediminis]
MPLSHLDQSSAHDLLIGPLTIRIQGRLHPEETDPFDFDWLTTSSTFKGQHTTSPGSTSFEAVELARFQADLIALADHAASELGFYPTEQICMITAKRRSDGQVDVGFGHESGDTAYVIVTDEDLRNWIDGLAAILRDYPPRTTLQNIS